MKRNELKELIKEEYHKTLNESKKQALLDKISNLENHLRSMDLKDKDLKNYLSWLNKIWITIEKAKI
jgi:hypothetical protein